LPWHFRPLPPGASREQQLRWVRRLYLETAPFGAVIWALVFLYAGLRSWVWGLFALVTLLQVMSVVSLSSKIRREQQRRRR
jgi:hypothetical protein